MYLRESASRAFTLLTKNPPLFGRVLLAKASAVRPARALPMRLRVGNVVFEVKSAEKSAVAAMFSGAYSPLVVDAMKRYLRPGDVFIDVGANVGYLSAVGAALAGPQGQVHSFEPVPRYFASLRRLTELNPSYSIIANQFAAGAVTGLATIHVTREPGQNTLVAGYKDRRDVNSTLEIQVIRLDSYIESHRLSSVALVKIDGEGFELPIIEGMRGLFDRGHRPAIICEIAPRAYKLLGRRVSDLSDLMSWHGYTARDIIDGKMPVDLAALKHVTDVLFLPES